MKAQVKAVCLTCAFFIYVNLKGIVFILNESYINIPIKGIIQHIY